MGRRDCKTGGIPLSFLWPGDWKSVAREDVDAVLEGAMVSASRHSD